MFSRLRILHTSKQIFLARNNSHSCKVLVLGGGSGGCSVAAKFVSKMNKGQVIVVDPADRHYYQPMFTMIGGGMKNIEDSSRSMRSVLPREALWIQDSVSHIDPTANQVTTTGGDKINYEYLIVALGTVLHYDKIRGALEGLKTVGSGVCSNYSPHFVEKTFQSLKECRSGNAVFTCPSTPIKCGGAPLKVCFISEHYLSKMDRRDKCKVYYRTALPAIFTAKHYALKLVKLCNKRDINYGLGKELVEVDTKNKTAVFASVEDPSKTEHLKYSMLHITPPMYPPEVLKSDKSLHDDNGYLKINKETLQHENYKNIFGLGDCTNLPTSKTAAAVAAQSGVVFDNLMSEMRGLPASGRYDGYTSCPLVTGYGRCIMAEFDYTLQPLETFPIDQSNEHFSMYLMKKDLMPALYWHAMLNGYWRGPKLIRKLLHLGMGR